MRDMLLFQWYLPLFVSLFTEIESDYFMFICKSWLELNTILHSREVFIYENLSANCIYGGDFYLNESI